MIRRTLDHRFLTQVANHPEVRPWLGGTGDINLEAIISNPANIALVTEGGGWVLTQSDAGVYEVHSMFLPEARKGVARAMREAMDYVFSRTDCHRLVTKVPLDNKGAELLARTGGFREAFRREQGFDGKPTSYQVLDLMDWAQQSKAALEAGRWFHDRLEAVKAENQSEKVVHDDDDAHDHAAGATILMCRGGQAQKGVWAYNQWATLAGYATVTFLGNNVIDLLDAVVAVRGDDMEILLCR